MLVGYVRVSTNDQNTALQRDVLERSGCKLIFEDKISGKTSDRPGLKRLLKSLSPGIRLLCGSWIGLGAVCGTWLYLWRSCASDR